MNQEFFKINEQAVYNQWSSCKEQPMPGYNNYIPVYRTSFITNSTLIESERHATKSY